MKLRLNKALSQAGVASRRASDRLIEAGRVCVNGEIVRELGVRVDPEHDTLAVDGHPVPRPSRTHIYLMLNKPRGCVTTMSDPEGRPTVKDLLGGRTVRVYPVGRLDFNSEGLLLLTNDGELSERLMHPRGKVPKTYMVKVQGCPRESALERLRRGVPLDGRVTGPAAVKLLQAGRNAWLQVTIREGRKHQVRRMLQAVGHRVVKLRRTAYGGVRLGDLEPGRLRTLTVREVDRLRRVTAQPRPRPSGGS